MKNLILKLIYRILAGYARNVIKEHKPFVIAITGSVGKTSTKEAVFKVLYDHFGSEVRKNEGNLNAEIGIPLTILGYSDAPSKFSWPFFLIKAYFRSKKKDYPKYLILEMGIEHKGDMEYFGTIVRLDIAIVTGASSAHLSNFKDRNEYQQEKLKVREILKENGKLILNIDDDFLAENASKDSITLAIKNKKAEVLATGIKVTPSGTEYRIEKLGQKIAIKSPSLGRQTVYTGLVAFLVGQIFEIQSLKIKKSLESIKPLAGRMNLLLGQKEVLIIDDTYNSNPTSVKEALNVLAEIEYNKGRKVAILGNMNELGAYEEESHREIGAYAYNKCDLAVFVGKNALLMQKAYGDESRSLSFPSRREVTSEIDQIVKPNDLVLIKASQNGNYFEEIVKNLLKDKSQAESLLVRQSKSWLKKK